MLSSNADKASLLPRQENATSFGFSSRAKCNALKKKLSLVLIFVCEFSLCCGNESFAKMFYCEVSNGLYIGCNNHLAFISSAKTDGREKSATELP